MRETTYDTNFQGSDDEGRPRAFWRTTPTIYGSPCSPVFIDKVRYTPMTPEQIEFMVEQNNLTQCLTCRHCDGINVNLAKVRCHATRERPLIGRLGGPCQCREDEI